MFKGLPLWQAVQRAGLGYSCSPHGCSLLSLKLKNYKLSLMLPFFPLQCPLKVLFCLQNGSDICPYASLFSASAESLHQHTWPESANGFNGSPCLYSCPQYLLYQAIRVIFNIYNRWLPTDAWSPIRCPRIKTRCCTIVHKGLAPADSAFPQLQLVSLSPNSLQPGLADLLPVPRWCQERVYPCQWKHCWEEDKGI